MTLLLIQALALEGQCIFCIEGSNSENHGAWPEGWRDHADLAQTKLPELTKLKNVSWLGF